ncbi:MAG: acylneuraminate cytidylyltransferase [Muribaculaceae bacterium]|nr:acylneuraminate cytidylyltransferase [Muribaculaceae bacterium]
MFWNLLFGHEAMAQDWANKARYAQANQEMTTGDPDPARVVLMGNSITEFWEETHPAFFRANHLVGRGISGQVSSQMLARFRQDVINLKPRLVVINCGTNDIAENNGPYDEDITMDNIMSMTELALAHGIEVVLTSILPCDQFCWNPSVQRVPEKINSLNQLIVAYSDTDEHIHYLDYFSVMTHDGRSMIKSFTEDGVHPNAAGYDMMEAKLTEMLERLKQ